jgi:phosphoribosylformylglycinamidine synthase
MDLKAAGDRLYVVGTTRAELAGSHFDAITGCSGGQAPRPATDAPALYRKLHQAMRAGLVRAAHDLSEGGLAAALAESAFAGEVGADVDLSLLHRGSDVKDDVEALFSETCGRLLVEVEEKNGAAFEAALAGAAFGRIGKTIAEPRLRIRGVSGKTALDVDLARLKRAWRETLFKLYA